MSISTISKFLTVTLSEPILPAILIPLKTLEGHDACPIEPGALSVCLLPWVASCLAKLCLLIVPAKPLPFDLALTSIISPTLKIEASNCCPSLYSKSSIDLNSAKTLAVSNPALDKWPVVGLLVLFFDFWPYANWTAL